MNLRECGCSVYVHSVCAECIHACGCIVTSVLCSLFPSPAGACTWMCMSLMFVRTFDCYVDDLHHVQIPLPRGVPEDMEELDPYKIELSMCGRLLDTATPEGVVCISWGGGIVQFYFFCFCFFVCFLFLLYYIILLLLFVINVYHLLLVSSAWNLIRFPFLLLYLIIFFFFAN